MNKKQKTKQNRNKSAKQPQNYNTMTLFSIAFNPSSPKGGGV